MKVWTQQRARGSVLETGYTEGAGFEPNRTRWSNRSVFSVVYFKPWISLCKCGLGSFKKPTEGTPLLGPISLVLINDSYKQTEPIHQP